MAPRKQEPISKTRVQRNRLLAAQTADATTRSQPTQAEINAMTMAGLQGATMAPGYVGAQRRNKQATQDAALADFVAEEAAALGITPYTGEYRGGATAAAVVPTGPQLPGTVAPATRTPYTPPKFTPVSSANPYLDYQRGLTTMADQATANFGNELADVQNRYKTLRDQVMAQFGNTKNPELIAARDIALAELARQSDDATKQVAANYQAAQADQLRFAEQQKALGAELGAQNAILANVAAGNIAAYADQAGLTDSAAQDTAAFLASQAPREQALASALGLSGGMFQSAMGTSLGEQQMAIQGQIARDLAARQGQVSTSTAQQIAAAQQAEREAGRQAYLNLVMDEMGALDRARSQMSERDFALRQAVLQGGVEAGRFAAEQGRYNRDLQMRQEESAYNRWLAGEELSIREREQASAAEQRRFENELALGKYQSEYGTQGTVTDLSNSVKKQVGLLMGSTNTALSAAGSTLYGLLISAKQAGDVGTAYTTISGWLAQNPAASKELKKAGYDTNTLVQALGF